MSNSDLVISIISLVISILGLGIAFYQIGGMKKQVKIALKNQKSDSLKIVLEIETQMTAMKMELDKVAKNIREKVSSFDESQLEIQQDYLDTAKENYLNSLDRLCFCFENGYVTEDEWRTEYRNLLKDTISAYPDDFNEASPYRHIKSMNKKWQDS